MLAQEVVAILQTFGILWGVSSGEFPLQSMRCAYACADRYSRPDCARHRQLDRRLHRGYGTIWELAVARLCLLIQAVARAGTPAIAVATCFGSPMLNDVLGSSHRSIAFIQFQSQTRSRHFVDDRDG